MLFEKDLKLVEETQIEGQPGEFSIHLPKKKLFLESYGCAMNFADSEIIASIMNDNGYETTQQEGEADLIFLNTCAIRDNAELKIWARLKSFRQTKRKNERKKRYEPGVEQVLFSLCCLFRRSQDPFLCSFSSHPTPESPATITSPPSRTNHQPTSVPGD